MKNSKTLYSEIISAIKLSEPDDEKRSIAAVLMEHFFQLRSVDIMANRPVSVSPQIEAQLSEALSRVNGGEPVQYITGMADFMGRKFFVSPAVLIPRPETEELVAEVIRLHKGKNNLRIADVGTGSGCIPITLALSLDVSMFATDISDDALAIARQNADHLNARVTFVQSDILNEHLPFGNLDVLVSNPPYIASSERHNMKPNVVSFEPHIALFVPEENPLIFYERISSEGRRALKSGGMIIFEINERFGETTADLLSRSGFQDITILKDISGKERIVKATNP